MNISEIALAKYDRREESKIKNHNKYDFIRRINCWKWQEVELNTWNSINIAWWAIHMHLAFPGYLFRQIERTLLIHMGTLGHSSNKSNRLQPPVTPKREKDNMENEWMILQIWQ